jgi:hypothetical protein
MSRRGKAHDSDPAARAVRQAQLDQIRDAKQKIADDKRDAEIKAARKAKEKD